MEIADGRLLPKIFSDWSPSSRLPEACDGVGNLPGGLNLSERDESSIVGDGLTNKIHSLPHPVQI